MISKLFWEQDSNQVKPADLLPEKPKALYQGGKLCRLFKT